MTKIVVSKEYKSRTVTIQHAQFSRRDPNFQPNVTQKQPRPAPIVRTTEPVQPLPQETVKLPEVKYVVEPVVVDNDDTRSPINRYFEKVFCINLDRRTDRWAECQAEFSKHNLDVQRVSAVDGSTMKDNGRLTSGEMGCSMSHVAVLEMMIESGLKRVLILEDDVEFIPNLNDFWAANQHYIPSAWSMLYFGGSHLNTPAPYSGPIYRFSRTYTTSAYGITVEMARSIVGQIRSMKAQVDVVYAGTHRGGSTFGFKPSIAWQRPGFSDVQQGLQDYDFIKK